MASLVLVILVIIAVNFAVIFRRIGNLEFPVWSVFLAIAVLLVGFGLYSFQSAVTVVADNADVMVFLFGMFVVVTALDISGVLDDFSRVMISKARNYQDLLFIIHLVLDWLHQF